VVVVVGDAGAELLADGARSAVAMNVKLLSCNAYGSVMLLTRMSGTPVSFRSANDAPIPLNESRPITLDFGVVAWRTP